MSSTTTASLPIIAPSFVYTQSYAEVGLLPCTGGNIHSYPGGGIPDGGLDANCAPVPYVAGTNSIWATETGYYTMNDGVQGIDFTAQAKYMPRLFLEYFRRGIVRTYSYELLDELSKSNPTLSSTNCQSHFGLV